MLNTFHTCYSTHTPLKVIPKQATWLQCIRIACFSLFLSFTISLLSFTMVGNIYFSVYCSSINFPFQKHVVGCSSRASVRRDARQTAAAAAEEGWKVGHLDTTRRQTGPGLNISVFEPTALTFPNMQPEENAGWGQTSKAHRDPLDRI